MGAIVAAAPCWATGTALGITAGNLLPPQLVSALGVALYGMFLAVIIPPAKKGQDHRPAHHRQLCGQLRRFRPASDRGAVIGHADHHLDRSPVGRCRFDRAGGTS